MKKLLIIFVLIFVGTGCEKEKTSNPPGPPVVEYYLYGECIWENQSDHSIVMSVFGYLENELLAPGEKFAVKDHSVGYIPNIFSWYLDNGMLILFDDGIYGGLFDENDMNNDPQPSPRHPKNFEYKEVEDYIDQSGVYYNRAGFWTYIFTNADYDAAVARGPMTEQ